MSVIDRWNLCAADRLRIIAARTETPHIAATSSAALRRAVVGGGLALAVVAWCVVGLEELSFGDAWAEVALLQTALAGVGGGLIARLMLRVRAVARSPWTQGLYLHPNGLAIVDIDRIELVDGCEIAAIDSSADPADREGAWTLVVTIRLRDGRLFVSSKRGVGTDIRRTQRELSVVETGRWPEGAHRDVRRRRGGPRRSRSRAGAALALAAAVTSGLLTILLVLPARALEAARTPERYRQVADVFPFPWVRARVDRAAQVRHHALDLSIAETIAEPYASLLRHALRVSGSAVPRLEFQGGCHDTGERSLAAIRNAPLFSCIPRARPMRIAMPVEDTALVSVLSNLLPKATAVSPAGPRIRVALRCDARGHEALVLPGAPGPTLLAGTRLAATWHINAASWTIARTAELPRLKPRELRQIAPRDTMSSVAAAERVWQSTLGRALDHELRRALLRDPVRR